MNTSLKWALATASGCLNGAAFIYSGPLALIANVPLLWALSHAKSAREGAQLGAWVGFLGGVHIFGVLSYGWWIFWAFSLYTASQMTLFGWVTWRGWSRSRALLSASGTSRVSRALSAAYMVLLPALIWTLTEWLRTIGPVALPASYVGCVADVPWMRGILAWASVGGGLLSSALIACLSSALALLSLSVMGAQDDQKPLRHASLITLITLASLWGWGTLRPAELTGEPLKVAALQGGFSNAHYRAAEADPKLSQEIIHTYEGLLKRAEDKGAELAIWAESAVRAPLLTTPELKARLLPAREGAPAIIGGLAHTDPDGRRYNLAISASRGELLGRYAKVKTVPGVEAAFTPGDAWRPLPTPWGPVGVLICFESIYPHAGRALAQAGARLMVVLSNDAGFGESPISHHMTNRAMVRAVESGRWLVRVGQAGISALINPRGEMTSRLGLFEAGALTGEVQLRDEPTPYTRFGLWWLWLVVLALLPTLSPASLWRSRLKNLTMS